MQPPIGWHWGTELRATPEQGWWDRKGGRSYLPRPRLFVVHNMGTICERQKGLAGVLFFKKRHEGLPLPSVRALN